MIARTLALMLCLIFLPALADPPEAEVDAKDVAAENAASEDVPVDELLIKGKSLYGQEKLELIIRHFFRDRRDGF